MPAGSAAAGRGAFATGWLPRSIDEVSQRGLTPLDALEDARSRLWMAATTHRSDLRPPLSGLARVHTPVLEEQSRMAPTERGPAREREMSLPDLTPFDGERLEAGGDHVAVDFVDLDFAGQDAPDARFLECRLQRCGLDGTSLRRARIAESLLSDVHAATVDFADSTWRDSQVWGGRLGAVTLVGATWTGIRIRGSHLGFLNLVAPISRT